MNSKLIKILVLMLALALTLTGCNLIEVDADMQADEDIEKLRKEREVTVATWDGGSLKAQDVLATFDSSYYQMNYLYSYYMGTEVSDEEARDMVNDTLTERVRNEIAAAHFDAEHELTQEELDEVKATVEKDFEEIRKQAHDSAEGKTEKQKNANARVMLYEVGRDIENDEKIKLVETKREKMEELLRETVEAPTEEELAASFEEHAASQEESFTADLSAFESAVSDNETLYWIPDGYRTVKHILVQPEDELLTAYTSAKSALTNNESDIAILEGELGDYDAETAGERTEDVIKAELEAAQALIADQTAAVESAKQACLDSVKESTDAIYAALEGGMSFEDAIKEYGQDPGMQNEPTATTGYYVCKDSTCWQSEFTEGAMALSQVGEYSAEPVLSGSGVHIILYASDVLGGKVPLENVREKLSEELFTEKKDAYVTETLDAWVEDQHPTYDADAFYNVYFG